MRRDQHPLLLPKWRKTQRHAEVHCLLQLPSLAEAMHKQMLIVEIADIGPSLGWAEPCSRECLHLLKKYGVSKVFFTDGLGSLVQRDLPHCPELDFPCAHHEPETGKVTLEHPATF
ncbi:unnamed protein product [Durusdinium trenchii]|uniref:Uncharacterized protein n=2 Tax=Durusdinium trenchii TaxID=1381693 RepID=A0ABP0S603_9DINO